LGQEQASAEFLILQAKKEDQLAAIFPKFGQRFVGAAWRQQRCYFALRRRLISQ
jgi:hypothetical protein